MTTTDTHSRSPVRHQPNQTNVEGDNQWSLDTYLLLDPEEVEQLF